MNALLLSILLTTAPKLDDSQAHFGASIGIGNVGVDLQVSRLVAFASTSWAAPVFSGGQSFFLALGVGPSWVLSQSETAKWYVDVYGLALPNILPSFAGTGSAISRTGVGFGAGAGLRYVNQNGFTFGLRLPLIGVDPTLANSTPAISVLSFFAEGLAGMPTFNIGYRF